jgi:hypothetical protein
LVIPSIRPGLGTQRAIGKVELAAWAEIVAFGDDALMVINVVLPAVLGLVLVWETSVIASSHKFEGLGY